MMLDTNLAGQQKCMPDILSPKLIRSVESSTNSEVGHTDISLALSCNTSTEPNEQQ